MPYKLPLGIINLLKTTRFMGTLLILASPAPDSEKVGFQVASNVPVKLDFMFTDNAGTNIDLSIVSQSNHQTDSHTNGTP